MRFTFRSSMRIIPLLVVLLALVFGYSNSEVLASTSRILSPHNPSVSNHLISVQRSAHLNISQSAHAGSIVSHIVSSTVCNPCGSGDLRYHNGAVQTQPMAYLIFWGSSWKNTSGQLIKSGQIVTKYFSDVSGTNFENILTQYYMQNSDNSQTYIPNTVQFASNTHVWIDPTTPPSDHTCTINTIEDTKLHPNIQAEVKKAINKNNSRGWPLNEGNATYFVYTPTGYAVNNGHCSNDPSTTIGFCSYHSTAPNVYAELVYPSSRCQVQNTPPNGDKVGDSLADSTSHEQFEATTDPFPGLTVGGQIQDGWYDSTGYTGEIGDKCNFFIPSYTKLKNGGVFDLQEEYSDTTHSCVNTFTPHLTVNTTADYSPPCAIAAYSLRCAITQVNQNGSGKPIWFNIPSSNSGCKLTTVQGKSVYICTITPASSIPQLLASHITIDGYTQPGAKKNTLTLGNGDNAILTIRIDGSKGFGGLVLNGGASYDTIQGLEITNFQSYGLLVNSSSSTHNTIDGNFVGTDGINPLGNGAGIYLGSGASNNVVGGQTLDHANLISGNSSEGIIIGAGSGNIIEGNYIGTNYGGNNGIPNSTGISVFAQASNNSIGGTTSASANIIAYNNYGVATDNSSNTNITRNTINSNFIGVFVNNGETGDGITQNTISSNGDAGILVGNSSTDNVHVSISHNSIFNNGGLGIDLYPADTVNCSTSTSGGPNDYLPCPVILSATTTQVSGTAFPGSVVEVYSASNETDDQGHGEGFGFLGNVITDNNGNWSISLTLPAGEEITATATYFPIDASITDTSEFAVNVAVS